ncbi:blue light sensor protein [Adhaeribacter arboris]|uniref:Blue light sensor protein n=1 Tax=Adhaeribacter arboris TaxID=2072846 RepID=A0A2T2YAT5_9BACT|nr:BLUF domain-containing protein [Adhaeribacter arboris]PSR52622.1 blue light sensor protein [Adhaeribacter arboris]
MHHIMYMSTALVLVQEEELTAMLTQYRRNNLRDNITGMLLYSGEHYVQLIEGAEEALRKLFAKICQDYHHTNLIKLADGSISQRVFENWSMGFRSVDEAALTGLKGYVNPESVALPHPEEESPVQVLQQFIQHNMTDGRK